MGKLISICFLLFACQLSDQSGQNQPGQTIDLNSSLGSLKTTNFIGIGGEWDTYYYSNSKPNSSSFQFITDKMDWMKPSLVRVMILTKYYYANGAYSYNSSSMQQLYRVLDYCQTNGIDVILTDWGVGEPGKPERSWLNTPGIVSAFQDSTYANVLCNSLDYLINTKSYSCIKYFVMGNEPNLEIGNWNNWKTAINFLRTAINAKASITNKIKLTGSDQSGNPQWHLDTVSQLNSSFDAFDSHAYPTITEVQSASLQSNILQHNQAIWDANPSSPKNIIVGEAGVTPLRPNQDNFEYGLYMADFAVQAMNAGVSGISAWVLDDNSYPNFYNGMWTDQDHGLKTRPWFFVWALITRSSPKASQVYSVTYPNSDLRYSVLELSGGGKSIIAVNEGNDTIKFHLNLNGSGNLNFYEYQYIKGILKYDAQGMPLYEKVINQNLSDPINLSIAPHSVSIVTSIAP